MSIKKHDIELALKKYGSVESAAKNLGIDKGVIHDYITDIEISNIKYRFPYTYDELNSMYLRLGSIAAIAAEVRRSYATVVHWLNVLDVDYQTSYKSIYQELKATKFTDLQKSFLVGSFLGSGIFRLAPHSKLARFTLIHNECDYNYLKWKHSILKPFVRPIKVNSNKQEVKFTTIPHKDITDIFINGIEYVLSSKINLLSVAVCAADRIISNKEKLIVDMSKFDYDTIVKFIEVFRPYFKGTIKISLYSNIGLVLEFHNMKYINDFTNSVKKVLPRCIHYKLT